MQSPSNWIIIGRFENPPKGLIKARTVEKWYFECDFQTLCSSVVVEKAQIQSLESSRIKNLVENNISHAWKNVLDQICVRRRG